MMESGASHKRIHSLSDDVRAVIRTGVALTSFAQVVEELVLNSIDAGATSVAVRVDLPFFKIQVVDNGSGISLEQLSFVGQRYSTSKCHSVQDLENLKYFGYRGEAVASLAAASSFVEISSRTAHSRLTYTKHFLDGKPQAIVQAHTPRPSVGTTVTAFDLFHNLPVRRKRLSEALEMEAIRYRLSGLALMWPKISFSLREDASGHVILQTHKCSGVAAAFSSIFTPARARKLMEIESVQNDEFKITGLVSIEGYSRKDLQFVFVNKRLVLKSSIHKQVNKILGRSLILKRRGLDNEIAAKLPTVADDINKSPVKQGDRYGIFVISIECPFKSYDITFDPSKTLVEFRDWPKLIHLLQDMLYPFLRKHNLLASGESLTPLLPGGFGENCSEDANSESSEPVRKQVVEENRATSQLLKYGRGICLTDTQNGVLSKAVCRPKKTVQHTIADKPVGRENSYNSLGKNSGPDVSDDGLTLLETPLIFGTTTNKSYALHNVEKHTKEHKNCQRIDAVGESQHVRYHIATERVQTAEKMAKDESDFNSCKGQIFRKDVETSSSRPSHARTIENPFGQHRNLHTLKTTIKSVGFDRGENQIPPNCVPGTSVLTEPSCKRKEITLSTGRYSSSLGQLREGIQGKNGSGLKSKAPEIITDSLQQLRRSARQAISELGDLYKTPERVSSRRKSSDSCSSNDDPIVTKQAKTGQHNKITEDTESLEDIGGIFKSKSVRSLNTHQPMSIVERDNVHLDNEKFKTPIPYDRTQRTDQVGLCKDYKYNKQETLTTTSRKESDASHSTEIQVNPCSGNSNTFLSETDRQSVVGNTSRLLLRPIKASLNSKTCSTSSRPSTRSFEVTVPSSEKCEKMKRKSPQSLTHSNKLARLMRGETLQEESTSTRKPKFFLQGFQYRKDAKKTEHTSSDNDLYRLTEVIHRKEQPREKSKNRLHPETSEDSDHTVQKQHKPAVENCRYSISHEQYEPESQICGEVDSVNSSCNFTETENVSRAAGFYQAALKDENESSKPTQESCASIPNRQEKVLHCCRCVYLRSKTRQPCSTCGRSLSSNRSLPFQGYQSVQVDRNEGSSPKVSVVLSLPVLQNHQEEMEKRSSGGGILKETINSESRPVAVLSKREDYHNGSKEAISEMSDVISAGRSHKSRMANQCTSSLALRQDDKDTEVQTRDTQKGSSPSFVSQGFSINKIGGVHDSSPAIHGSQIYETKCTSPVSPNDSLTKTRHVDTNSRDDFNCYSSQHSFVSDDQIDLKGKSLIASPGTESDVYFEAGMSVIQSLLAGASNMLPKPSCDQEDVEKNGTHEFKSTDVESQTVSSNSSLSNVLATSVAFDIPLQDRICVKNKNILVAETLSQSKASDEGKEDSSFSKSLMLCTIPETESLEHDNLSSKDFRLVSSKQSVRSTDDVDSTRHYNNSQSQNDSEDETDTKNNVAQESCSNVTFEKSQEKPYSLTLAQKSCTLTNTVQEDSDSFSIFSKPFVLDDSMDPVHDGSLTDRKDVPFEPVVTKNSESLFESSDVKLGCAPGQNDDTVSACDSSNSRSFHEAAVINLPASTKLRANNPSNQNIKNIVSKGQENERNMSLRVFSQDVVTDLMVRKSLCDEQTTKIHNKSQCGTNDTPAENQWRSGDQTLLMVETPDGNPSSQSSQRDPSKVHNDSRRDPNESCSGATQPLTQEPGGITSKKHITISAGLNPSALQSSLSLLRDHAKSIIESEIQSTSISSKPGPRGYDRPYRKANDIEKELQTQKQQHDVMNCGQKDGDTPFVRTANHSFSYPYETDGHCSLLNEEEHLKSRNFQLPTNSSDISNNTTGAPDFLSGDRDIYTGEKGERFVLPNLDSPRQEQQTKMGHNLMPCWRKETDAFTGRTVFVNNQSGHTVTQEQWPEMSSQSLRELMTLENNKNDSVDQELKPLSSSGRQAITNVINTHMEEDEAEAETKWRGGRKFTYEKEAGMDVSTLLAKWTNPVFSHHKSVSVDAEVCPSATIAKSCFNSMSKLEFTKDMLEKVKVIGQLDNKFIACETEHTKYKIEGLPSSLLVLFDQHAVHERIRLEYYTQECYVKNGEERTNTLEKAEVNPVQTMVMDQDDVRIMKAFRRDFARIGVNFSVGETSRTTIHISSIPACILEREPSEVKRRRAMNVEEKVECLIKEHINLLKSTNGACGGLPLTVHKHLCSLACHGAVKFGDQLTLSECKDLLSALSRCNLPFQCAHGRPSVAPIVNMTELEQEVAKLKKKPKLWKITAAMNS